MTLPRSAGLQRNQQATKAIGSLKGPLSTIITTSNAIFDITDLTPEELHEYLKQIRLSANKLNEILHSLPLHADVDQEL